MQLRKFSLPLKKEKWKKTNLENLVQMNEEQSRVNVSEQASYAKQQHGVGNLNNRVLLSAFRYRCCYKGKPG